MSPNHESEETVRGPSYNEVLATTQLGSNQLRLTHVKLLLQQDEPMPLAVPGSGRIVDWRFT